MIGTRATGWFQGGLTTKTRGSKRASGEFQRLYRARPRKGEFADRGAGGAGTRRSARSCAAVRTARAGENHAGANPGERNGFGDQDQFGAAAREERRPHSGVDVS